MAGKGNVPVRLKNQWRSVIVTVGLSIFRIATGAANLVPACTAGCVALFVRAGRSPHLPQQFETHAPRVLRQPPESRLDAFFGQIFHVRTPPLHRICGFCPLSDLLAELVPELMLELAACGPALPCQSAMLEDNGCGSGIVQLGAYPRRLLPHERSG